ncbi:MAG: hypothetical protein IJU08_03080 [Bacteroidales bacterium]|nr:hypothetical protein [Bacteroidales bacterium]MBQ9397458.1 hypothetical protein [Bacteroidales bacterium]
MSKKRIIIALLAGALVWAGCQPVEVESISDITPRKQTGQTDSVWTLTIRAEKVDSPRTKGLAIDGTDESSTTVLKSVWLKEEKVYVYLGDKQIGTLTVAVDKTDPFPHQATLSGTVTTADITPGSTRLTLLTPYTRDQWTYVGQGGMLLVNDGGSSGLVNSIAARYHMAQAQDVLVTEVSDGNLTTEKAIFENQQSIYRINFRFQKGELKIPITARAVTITARNGGLWKGWNMGTGPITVNLLNPTADPFFVALRNEDTSNEEDLHFEVIATDGVTYLGSKTIPAQYKPNGTFVSAKNTTLTSRLGVAEISSGSVSEAL